MSNAANPRPLRSLCEGSIPVEIGCTAYTGVRSTALGRPAGGFVTDPVLATVPLTSLSLGTLGSSFQRAGAVRKSPALVGDRFVDPLGAGWLASAEGPSPLDHPLEQDETRLSTLVRPTAADGIQRPVGRAPALLDAPLPGLLEICVSLRGGWNFLDDCASGAPIVPRLLDWAEEALSDAYADALEAADRPVAIAYRDTVGADVGPYFSERDFSALVAPRLTNLFSSIRRRSGAPILAVVRGAARPLLRSFVDLGVEAVGVDAGARGMTVPEVRRAVGSSVVIHGAADLVALGRALEGGDLKGVALLASEFAAAVPVVAAPLGPIASAGALAAAARGAAFLNVLTGDELSDLRRVGPVRSIIDRAAGARPPEFVDVIAEIDPACSRTNPRRTIDGGRRPAGSAEDRSPAAAEHQA